MPNKLVDRLEFFIRCPGGSGTDRHKQQQRTLVSLSASSQRIATSLVYFKLCIGHLSHAFNHGSWSSF